MSDKTLEQAEALQKKKDADLFFKKLNALGGDKRPYHKRLIIAAAAVFSFCFTFLFFGPVEITAFGQQSVNFTVGQITPLVGVFALAVFVILSAVLSLLRGRLFNYAVTLIFGVTLCGYIQGNFLNGQMGALTGDTIAWQSQKAEMLLNLGFWLILCLVPFVILYFNRKFWKNLVIYGSAVLFVMQAVALVGIYAGAFTKDTENADYYLSNDGMVDYSNEQNTLVFLLDRLDYDYIEQVLKKDPDFFDRLDGFTSYTNAISEHARTRPAANFILNACEEGQYQIPAREYFDKAWNSNGKSLLRDLKGRNYRVDIYSDYGSMFGSGEWAEEYVANLTRSNSRLNVVALTKNLVYLSAYRYAPTTMKPFFWCYTDTVNNSAYNDSVAYEIDEAKFAAELMHAKTKNQKMFKFYHFNGPHPPYILKETGEKSENPTTASEQTFGSFRILFKTFEKMKEMGIYKDASIIITADHGIAVDDYKPLQKANRIGLFYKPAGKEGTPLSYSKAPVSLKNIAPTVLKSAGADYSAYGRALDEIGENEQIVRTFYKSVMGDKHEKDLYIYEVTGDAADFGNWRQKEIVPVRHHFY